MNKEICLIRGTHGESRADFCQRMHHLAQDLNLRLQPPGLSMTITAEPPPLFSVIPFKKRLVAVISIYGKKLSPARPDEIPGFAGVYQAEEALPVKYQKTWPDHKPTAGVCLLTLFKKRKGIGWDTFLNRWHNSHTPLSLRIHPLWHYNRNVVTGSSGMNHEPWDGIVEEHFRERADLLNPFRFFGKPHVILGRMIHVYFDTRSFLDYGTIEPYLAKEYWIRSFSGNSPQ
jgi:hypothetical protein